VNEELQIPPNLLSNQPTQVSPVMPLSYDKQSVIIQVVIGSQGEEAAAASYSNLALALSNVSLLITLCPKEKCRTILTYVCNDIIANGE
jgi:hypothetical protein